MIAERLKSKTLSARDWWSTLKIFIVPNSKSSIPPLEFNGSVITDERDKANVLNNYFESQTFLNDQDAVLQDLPRSSVESQLQSIVITTSKVELVLETLSNGKASDSVIVSFERYHTSFSIHSVLCLISHCTEVSYQVPIKKQMFVLSQKREIYLRFLIIDQYHC